MRVITRPDFDGIVCDVLLRDIFDIDRPTEWIEPYEIKDNFHRIGEGDIVANLQYVEGCSLWFDHHQTNKTDKSFEGVFEIAPSAAGIIYRYYDGKFSKDFSDLVAQTDRIDSGNITRDEVLNIGDYPYMMLSSTISGRNREDEPYWNRVVELLGSSSIEEIIYDEEIKERYSRIIEKDKAFASYLLEHTSVKGNTAVTDFRSLEVEPKGNRFLVYSLFPDIFVDAKIRFDRDDRQKVIVSLGQNIFNSGNMVNLGKLVSQFGGGGHKGAGSCSFHASAAEDNISRILDVLGKNRG